MPAPDPEQLPHWKRQFLDSYASDEDHEAARASEQTPDSWLRRYFPAIVDQPMAPHHNDFWAWIWALRRGHRPPPLIAIWPRGGAKSSSAELAVAAIGARNTRRYVLYVSETQEQANKHLDAVKAMLESPAIGRDYPALGNRRLTKYGHSKGWTSNRLTTAGGFTIEAIGLDTASRGFKVEDQRPDLIVVDDIDSELDNPLVTKRKIKTLTRALMPAGSTDVAFLGIQNLIHPDSVFAQLADGRADFLANRILSGPVPAVTDLVTEQRPAGGFRIVSGTATWEGQNLTVCQAQIDDWGLTAFLAEAQHEVEPPPGGMFDHLEFRRCAWDEMPQLVRTVVWVDPAVTNTDQSDAMGIQADGLGVDSKVYRLFSWEQRTSPVDALSRAILKAYEIRADHVGVETDQGGDAWESVYREALARVLSDHPEYLEQRAPGFVSDKAGAGHGPKTHRASKMLVDYEHGMVVHVIGTHDVLERALRRFPLTKPYDLTDAAYWSWQDLTEQTSTHVVEDDTHVSTGPDI